MNRFPLALLSLLLSLPVSATEWHVYGPRAMGMGGAGVAIPQAGLSSYWNPATQGLSDNGWGIQTPVSAHATIFGTTIQGANDLNAVTKDCQSSPQGSLCTSANITAALTNLGRPGNGALGDAGAGAHVKVMGFVFFVDDLAYVGATPRVDRTNVATVPGATFIGNNQSRLTLRGISVSEFGAGYGREIPFLPGLLVGANAKIMNGKVGYYDYYVANNNSGNSGSLSSFTKGAKTSVQPGLDVGVMWDIGKTWDFIPMHPRLGLTGRNVNNPKFDQPDQAKTAGEPTHYSLQGQARAGAAISPFKFWNIAVDMDLTHNLTPVDGSASQIVSVGTEVNVFNRTWLNIPLRAGLSQNIAVSGSKTALSGGAGLNFAHFTMDAAVTASPSTQQVQ
jgi:hypothetical protein